MEPPLVQDWTWADEQAWKESLLVCIQYHANGGYNTECIPCP